MRIYIAVGPYNPPPVTVARQAIVKKEQRLTEMSSQRQISPEFYLYKFIFLRGDILEFFRGKSSVLSGKKINVRI